MAPPWKVPSGINPVNEANTDRERGRDAMTTAFFRTIILYLILMVGLRLMGKRQIGEL